MKKSDRAQAEFYIKNQVLPESQDISELDYHFQRRAALYSHLGIPPLFLKGRSVLEIGPGNGENSLFTLSCMPGEYVLVEPNSGGLEKTKQLLEKSRFSDSSAITYLNCFLDDYSPDSGFDLVLCEGLIPGRANPENLLRKVLELVNPQGIAVVTCSEHLAFLSDAVRKILGLALAEPSLSVLEQAKNITPFFESHFSNLPGMSRNVKDWALDNVFNHTEDINFSIPRALEAAGSDADFYSSSPVFFSDWRWYKQITGKEFGFGSHAVDLWSRIRHSTLNHTCQFPPADPNVVMALVGLAERIFDLSRELASNRDLNILPEVSETLLELVGKLRLVPGDTAWTCDALLDAGRAVSQVRHKGIAADCGRFAALFGKGQQHLSLMKR
ncbi:bifunctional 2-polyprenyl-6-hydroxyphenol methylase/3-demethylubiquinol 3-O-methyltransferase UbiG [Desulfovibrio sp. JC022]|uniref:class I SAM-dependent methyltransferase n=1 Tax=Desulfovibrio sp. JC022 TaxID=2593642 RepID=UPI0013D6D6FE|nr:class I SAM-dependent methyltransferase [Desulfovibrio sp. JC022]NDV22224.1 class I SAM-dependent methyltransferase [Desulfovibrio sp. JC022]